jgi:hypothetical protein
MFLVRIVSTSFLFISMAPYALQRSDEPHLFDALCALFVTRGISDGRYGVVTIRSTTYDFFFKTPTHVLVYLRNFGTYAELEDAALELYNDIVDPYRAREAEDIASYDPAFGGRPYCTAL